MKFIYLINVVDGFHTLLIIALWIFGVFALIYAIGMLTQLDSYNPFDTPDDDPGVKHYKGKMWKFIWSFLFTFFLFSFIPSKQTMYEIFGIGTVIDYVQSNDNVKKIPDKCIEAVNLWLDEKMEDIKGKDKPEN